MTFVGDEIKRTRKRHGMTSKQMAAQAEISEQYASDIQHGRRMPSMDTLLDICNVFPDADPAQWAWLMVRDIYGNSVFDLMWTYARREWGVAHDPA